MKELCHFITFLYKYISKKKSTSKMDINNTLSPTGWGSTQPIEDPQKAKRSAAAVKAAETKRQKKAAMEEEEERKKAEEWASFVAWADQIHDLKDREIEAKKALSNAAPYAGTKAYAEKHKKYDYLIAPIRQKEQAAREAEIAEKLRAREEQNTSFWTGPRAPVTLASEGYYIVIDQKPNRYGKLGVAFSPSEYNSPANGTVQVSEKHIIIKNLKGPGSETFARSSTPNVFASVNYEGDMDMVYIFDYVPFTALNKYEEDMDMVQDWRDISNTVRYEIGESDKKLLEETTLQRQLLALPGLINHFASKQGK